MLAQRPNIAFATAAGNCCKYYIRFFPEKQEIIFPFFCVLFTGSARSRFLFFAAPPVSSGRRVQFGDDSDHAAPNVPEGVFLWKPSF